MLVPDWLHVNITVRFAYAIAHMSCAWSRDIEHRFRAAESEVRHKVIDRALEAARARRCEDYQDCHCAQGAVLTYRVVSNIYSVTLEYLAFIPNSPDPNGGKHIGNPIEGFSFTIYGSDKTFDICMIHGDWPGTPSVMASRLELFVSTEEIFSLAKRNPGRERDRGSDPVQHVPGIQPLDTWIGQINKRDKELRNSTIEIESICGSDINIGSAHSSKLTPTQLSVGGLPITSNALSRPSCKTPYENIVFARVSFASDNFWCGRDVARASGLPHNGALHPH
jgi:hypothetical protein